MLGTRPAEELAYIRSDQALQFLSAMPAKPKVPWGTLFPEASEKALDLLDRMLQFHPSKRVRGSGGGRRGSGGGCHGAALDDPPAHHSPLLAPLSSPTPTPPPSHPAAPQITVDAAMAHPYFDSVRSQYNDPDPVLPLGPGGFEFSFEYDEGLTVADYRRLIVEEAASFRAEKALARRLRAEKLAAMGGEGGSEGGAPASGDGPTVAGNNGDDEMGGAAATGAPA